MPAEALSGAQRGKEDGGAEIRRARTDFRIRDGAVSSRWLIARGEVLREEFLAPMGVTQAAFAKHIGAASTRHVHGSSV